MRVRSCAASAMSASRWNAPRPSVEPRVVEPALAASGVQPDGLVDGDGHLVRLAATVVVTSPRSAS